MDPDKTALLFGPYKTPALKPGDVTSCLYRDRDVRVFGWTDARIPWPLCWVVGSRTGGKGILVEDELARAIMHESATAIGYWWGVCRVTVTKWRRALGIGRKDAEGSLRLIHLAAMGGLNARHKRSWSHARIWTAEETALLGTLPDDQVAARFGRSEQAVSRMRCHLGIPPMRATTAVGRGVPV